MVASGRAAPCGDVTRHEPNCPPRSRGTRNRRKDLAFSREIRYRGDGAPRYDLTSIQQVRARAFQQYVRPGHAELVSNGYVAPHFKGGLGQVHALRAEVNRQGPKTPAAVPFPFNPLAGI